MTHREILNATEHRPWGLPDGDWKFYQEWNRAIFLHWPVKLGELQKFVPRDLEIDLFDGKPWVSLVAFTMENIRPRFLPPFPPITTFDEINVRTYVRSGHKTGVYFLSIEAGTKVSCMLARAISELPYRYSTIRRSRDKYSSTNVTLGDRLHIDFKPGGEKTDMSDLDLWLTERYALFQDTKTHINGFDIHHVKWPIREINIGSLEVHYPRFDGLLWGAPALTHYSDGVQVLAWGKDPQPKADLPHGKIMGGLIEEYKRLAAFCCTTDYADKASVKKHNRAVQRMYEIVEAVGTAQVPETLDQFAELLDLVENQTNIWAAVQMLERRKVELATEEKALNIIRRAASGTDENALGYRHWLKVWNEKNEDRI